MANIRLALQYKIRVHDFMQNFFITEIKKNLLWLSFFRIEISLVLDVTFISGWAEFLLGRGMWMQKSYFREKIAASFLFS